MYWSSTRDAVEETVEAEAKPRSARLKAVFKAKGN